MLTSQSLQVWALVLERSGDGECPTMYAWLAASRWRLPRESRIHISVVSAPCSMGWYHASDLGFL